SAASRSSTTVLACRGATGTSSPRARARALAKNAGGSRCPDPATSADLDDDLDLDRGVEREYGDADGAAGVPAGGTEDLAEQLGRAVDDPRLAEESRRAGDEADDLHD